MPQRKSRLSSASRSSVMPSKRRVSTHRLSSYSARKRWRRASYSSFPGARPKPVLMSPRAPLEACARRVSIGRGSRCRSARMRFSARPRSGAVSAKVPSRSNRTTRTPFSFTAASPAHAVDQVVDRGIGAERVDAAERVVAHADDFAYLEPCPAAMARELRGLDELHVVVRSLGKELQHVLRADDRKGVGLEVAVDRRKKYSAAFPRELGAGAHRARRVGHVLEQLHAGDD